MDEHHRAPCSAHRYDLDRLDGSGADHSAKGGSGETSGSQYGSCRPNPDW